jgi:glycosyltransferase involved in cell wall biosynthesis
MRIAYVCADPGVPVFGRKGCSVHAQEVLRALRGCGARVELFATRPGEEPPADLRALPVHPLPAVPPGGPAARERAALDANGGLRAALEREGPFDLIYERYSLWSFAGMEHARGAGVPGLLEVNAPLAEEQAAYRGLADREAAERVAGRAFGAAAALLAVSREVAGWLEGYPAARGRVHVVPNGVDLSRFPPGLAPSRPAPPGTFTVGFVGSLKPWHGLPVLAEAFALLRRGGTGSRLLVVGDGGERRAVEADLAARGVAGDALFTGAVAPDEVPGLLASVDVAVAPYPPQPRFYFSPLKVYEYMAAGRPVVASRVGQVAELIEDGVTGLLCPPGDPAALAAALERLRGEPGLRARLGEAARAAVRRDHTWAAVARRILRLAGLTAGARVAAARRGYAGACRKPTESINEPPAEAG